MDEREPRTAELKWTRYTPLGSVALFKFYIWLFHHRDRVQIGRVTMSEQ